MAHFFIFQRIVSTIKKNNEKFQEKIINCNVLFERIVAFMVLLTMIQVQVQVQCTCRSHCTPCILYKENKDTLC